MKRRDNTLCRSTHPRRPSPPSSTSWQKSSIFGHTYTVFKLRVVSCTQSPGARSWSKPSKGELAAPIVQSASLKTRSNRPDSRLRFSSPVVFVGLDNTQGVDPDILDAEPACYSDCVLERTERLSTSISTLSCSMLCLEVPNFSSSLSRPSTWLTATYGDALIEAESTRPTVSPTSMRRVGVVKMSSALSQRHLSLYVSQALISSLIT